MNQQIAISGLGGQGVLFITRILAEAALAMGLDLISSETHGMAMRGGAVISHLKVGSYASPLIRAGQADLAIFLAEENLKVHPQLIGPKTRVVLNAPAPGKYDGLDADTLAERAAGRRQVSNLVVLGYALGRNFLFTGKEPVEKVLEKMSKTEEILNTNLKALRAGLASSA